MTTSSLKSEQGSRSNYVLSYERYSEFQFEAPFHSKQFLHSLMFKSFQISSNLSHLFEEFEITYFVQIYSKMFVDMFSIILLWTIFCFHSFFKVAIEDGGKPEPQPIKLMGPPVVEPINSGGPIIKPEPHKGMFINYALRYFGNEIIEWRGFGELHVSHNFTQSSENIPSFWTRLLRLCASLSLTFSSP